MKILVIAFKEPKFTLSHGIDLEHVLFVLDLVPHVLGTLFSSVIV